MVHSIMADDVLDKNNWEFVAWINLALFFVVSCLCCLFGAIGAENQMLLWFYFLLTTVLFFFATLNVFLLKGMIRSFIAFAIVNLNTFILPLAFFAYSNSIRLTIFISLIYVILMIAIVPRMIGFTVLVTGVCFTCYQKYFYLDMKETGSMDFYYIAFVFLLIVLVAYCWRLLIQRMYTLFINAAQTGSQLSSDEIIKLKQKLDQIKNDERLLKEEIAIHITEMDNIAK